MPIHEYVCDECDAEFERLILKLTKDNGKIDFPSCGSMKVSKRFSSFAVKSDYVSVPTATASSKGQGSCCGGFCGCN